jgi:DNA-directed RNA polymerase specialized sigma24 family protein
MTKDLSEKIAHYKSGDKEILKDILTKMEPLVIRYAKKTFLLEFEDAKQEYYIVIINACNKISVYEHDAQCLKYIESSVKNKYCNFCKEYYAAPDTLPIEEDMFCYNNCYDDIETENAIKQFFNTISDKKGYKKQIFYYSVYMGMSDADIGKQIGLTRQYVHLLRGNLARALLAEFRKG